MKQGIGNIFLSWRPGQGSRRIMVGTIRQDDTGLTRFSYDPGGVKEAKEYGFAPYSSFPDTDKEYTENVLEIFSQRLTNSEREDIQKYYDFWEIEPDYKDDKYYLLAHTQGILATDNFEFLADYFPEKDLMFVSEICGLSHSQLPSNIIETNELLRWEADPSNEYDPYAVKIFKDDICLGYVKKVHSKTFYKEGNEHLVIKVKSISKNGYLNRVFIKIFYSNNF